jgi:hypothetical protein
MVNDEGRKMEDGGVDRGISFLQNGRVTFWRF